MESKKISELEQYNGSANGFMVPGVAGGETQKADLGAMVDRAAGTLGYLKPSGLKTINGESIAGSGDLNVAVMNPLKGTFLDTDTLPATGQDGDYIFVVNTNVMPRTANVWAWNGTVFADTGKSVEDFGLQFASGQTVPGTGIKDLEGNNAPSASGVLSSEAGKGLNERLYGSHDESTSGEITLSDVQSGLFINPSAESGNAYVVGGNGRKGMIAPEAFAGIKSYKLLRVTQGENYGGVTFVKKEAPTGSMTYQQLVEGGYLSAVHTDYENVVINLPQNTTTDVEIPVDAYTAYFLYRRAADGSGVADTYRKPTMVVGYGLKTEGELGEIWDKINEIEEGGGDVSPIDGERLIDGSVGGEKLAADAVGKSITVETEEHPSFNLIDFGSLIEHTYVGRDGEVVQLTAGNYKATQFIPLRGRKVYWFGMGSYGTSENGAAVYDADKNPIRVFRPGPGAEAHSYDPVEAAEGAEYIRLTLAGAGSLFYAVYAKEDGSNPMAEQTGVTTNMIDDYYRNQVIRHAGIDVIFPKENVPELIPALSMAGQNGFSKTVAAVGPGQEATYVEVADTEYPSYLKCCHTISFKGFLGTLGESDIIRFGIRRNSTTGKVVDITGTQVKIMRYDRNYGYVGNVTFTHGLTISDFIMCEVSFDWHGGKIRLISREGAFVQGWQNTQYANQDNPQINYGRVFLEPTVVLSNVKLSQSSDRFMKPVWVIGDSYTSMSSRRWTWQLINNFGIDGFLLDGYAGAPSENMVPELQMLLRYGTPKYLYWCLGMNDGPAIWKCCSTEVEMLCRERGVTLVYQTIPRPSSDQGEGIGTKGIINNYIKESGYRYIDVFDAVTENRETGAWYSGMLDDGTHPTELGAKVIAGQVLVDFPEIANYK